MSGSIDPKKIKSASRVLEVLEFFNAERTTATVMEIARELGYPQSSTSELLGCLVELGFLHRNRQTRTYRPTARVAMLGSWVHPRLMRHGNLLRMMDTLAEETGLTVVLAGTFGLNVQYLQIVGEGGRPTGRDRAGSLTHGVMGRLQLSVYDRPHIRKLVHRLNAEAIAEEDRVSCEDVLAEIDHIRRYGHAATPGLAEGKGGMCGVLLPQSAADEPLSLGLVLREGEGNLEQALRSLRNAVALHLGPVLANHNRDVIEPIRQYY